MTKVWWREAFKFLAGAAFTSCVANGYLYAARISPPFLGYTIRYTLLGLRAVVAFAAFLLFFYFGYVETDAA